MSGYCRGVISFRKYEGLGNDFLLVDVESQATRPIGAETVRALCDRHRGIGADGVLFVGMGEKGPFFRIQNADGSEPEMCGNGLRCVAIDFVRRGLVEGSSFIVDTAAGPHRCEVIEASGEGRVRIEMRAASLLTRELPLDGAGETHIDRPLEGLTGGLRFTAVSMGNPHVVTFDRVSDETRLELAPRIESAPRFAKRVNVGFATMKAGAIELRVFERGVGWTEACGTGACAAAVAAVETGRAPRHTPIEVRLPGGSLVIEVGERGESVKMTGPARYVFTGETAFAM